MGPRAEGPAPGSASDAGRAVHARLLGRDPTAPSDLAADYLPPLVAALQRAFPGVDAALLESCAIDLILDLAERPAQYDPNRLPLRAYLLMAAKRDVVNALERERRRARRHVPLEHVELSPPARNTGWASADDPAETLADQLDGVDLAALRQRFDAREWEVVQLMIDGERRTEPFARLLGLEDRSRPEQAREVKRVKDRLKKRLQRHWSGADDDG